MKRRNWFLVGIYELVVILNVLSWCSAGFGDKIRRSVFQVTQYVQGHISSVFPFSVGEILLILAVLLLLGAFVLALACFTGLCQRRRTKSRKAGRETADTPAGKKSFAGRYFYALSWIVGVVGIIMSTNCFALYHCSSFQETYMPAKEQEYTLQELAILRDYVVRQCNELAKEMERDENGDILYEEDMDRQGIGEMKRLGEWRQTITMSCISRTYRLQSAMNSPM